MGEGEEGVMNKWDDAREPWDSWYDVAQICTNGHVTNWANKRWPEHNQARCSACGAATTTACESCKHPIRGEYHVYSVARLSGWNEPVDRKSTRLNSSHIQKSRMPSSA